MIENLLKNKKIAIVLSLSLFAVFFNLFLYLHILSNFPQILNSFDFRYMIVAENLYRNDAYSFCMTKECIPTASILPVFPFVGYLIFSIFGTGHLSLEVIRIIFIMSNIGIIFFTYKIGKLLSFKVGCVAALFAMLDLSAFSWANDCEPDTLYAFIYTVSVYYMINFIKNVKPKYLIISSLFLGLASLTKPGMYLLGYPLTAFLFVFLIMQNKISLRKGLRYLAIFLLIQVVFIMGWKFRNYATTGYWVFSSQVGSIALFEHGSFLTAYQKGISFEEAQEELKEKYDSADKKEWDSNSRSLYFQKIAAKLIISSPFDYAIIVLKDFPKLFFASPPPDFLYSKQKREDLYKTLGIQLTNKYSYHGKISSLPHLSKHTPSQGGSSSLSHLKKLWEKGSFYSYIIFWGLIKSHLIVIYLMVLIGMVFLLRSGSDQWILFMIVISVSYLLAAIGPAPAPRHRVVVMPMFYFLSSYGMICLGTYILKWKKKDKL